MLKYLFNLRKADVSWQVILLAIAVIFIVLIIGLIVVFKGKLYEGANILKLVFRSNA